MDGSLHQLLPMYERARAEQDPLVLATVIATRGSTYRKAGAQMLIGPGGRYEGILSGGCLEGDLAAHAASVLHTGTPKMVRYDNRGDDDLLWGLGAGCEGGMDVWLVRLDPAANWEPFATLSRCFEQRERAMYAFVLDSAAPAPPVGTTLWIAGGPAPPAGLPEQLTTWLAAQARGAPGAATCGIVEFDSPRVRLFLDSVAVPRELLLIGGGPDALPVVEFGAALGWRVTVADHRPAYADTVRFPRARRVLLSTPAELAQHVDLTRFDAAVVMSHHIATDLAALEALAATPIPYVGLLGPASRRQRLLVGSRSGDSGEIRGAPACTGRSRTRRARSGEHRARNHRGDPGASAWQGTRAGTRSQHRGVEPARDAAGRRQLVAFRFAEAAGRHRRTTHARAHAGHGAAAGTTAPRDRRARRGRRASSSRWCAMCRRSVAFNPDHAQGMASSIRAGLAQAPFDARGALIALADQVAVTADDLRQLVSRWEQQPDRIVAALYDDTIGVPAIFPADLFRELAELQGDRGARVLLSRYPERVIGVPMPSAAQDIDTPGDLSVSTPC